MLPNLTLSGDATNARLGARRFAEKQKMYGQSPIGMTRRLAGEEAWGEEALERRAEDLERRILERWPWHDPRNPNRMTGDEALDLVEWRMGDGPWRTENTAAAMVLKVAAALLDADSANAERLSGEALLGNIHPASRYRPGTKAGSYTMRGIPGHADHVLYPYRNSYRVSAAFCRRMGDRCGAAIEVRLPNPEGRTPFWRLLRQRTGGVEGQRASWLGPRQTTSPLNSFGDRIQISVANPLPGASGRGEHISLWVRARAATPERAGRMRRSSHRIREVMGDQETSGDPVALAEDGWTIGVVRPFSLADRDEWPDAADWIGEQYRRLVAIVSD